MADPTTAAKRAAWQLRLAHRRARRNHWAHVVETERRRRIIAIRQLARWQDLVAEAFARVQALEPIRRQAITMYDSVKVDAVPASCKAFAGYVAGNSWSQNYAELSKRFPAASRVSITLTADADADVLDCEPGGASPKDVPRWLNRQWERGLARPCIYASLSWWPAIDGEIKNQGWSRAKRRRIRRWQAHYDGVREIPRGYDGKQYESGAYDTSLVRSDFFSQ